MSAMARRTKPRAFNARAGAFNARARAFNAGPQAFYARSVEEAERLAEAAKLEGFDDELALLRARLREHSRDHPEDLDLLIRGTQLVVRAVAARYKMSPQSADDFASALAGVAREVEKIMGGDGD
jgi:hypothetical protein